MPYLSRNGTQVFHDDRGTGDPPIVLVHGIGNHSHFAAQIEHFQRGHRVIAPDLPGFGHSAPPPNQRYAISDHADHVAWLCDALGLRAPVLIGHSMGGAIAFEIAAARPDLPSALVLLDPLPVFPVPALREQRIALVAALGGPDYGHALRGFAESKMFRPTDDTKIRANSSTTCVPRRRTRWSRRSPASATGTARTSPARSDAQCCRHRRRRTPRGHLPHPRTHRPT